jgi:hypothetical protein
MSTTEPSAADLAAALARKDYFRIGDARVAWWPTSELYMQIMRDAPADRRAMLREASGLRRPPCSEALWRDVVARLPDALDDLPWAGLIGGAS